MVTLYRFSTNNVATYMSPSPRFNMFPQAQLKANKSTNKSTNNVVTFTSPRFNMSPSPRFNKLPQALLNRLKPSRSTYNVVNMFP